MFELMVSCFEIKRFGEHETSLFQCHSRFSGPYASKNPTDFIHLSRVLKWDRSLFAIYMQRDGRDVIVSQHGSQTGRYWCDFGLWQRNQDRLMHFPEHPRLAVCRYEDLVTRPDDVQDYLAERFPFLVRTNRFSDFEKIAHTSGPALQALNGVRQISTQSVGAWRSNLPRVKAQVELYPQLGRYLIEAGYEPDETWLAMLDDVEADTTPSVRREHDPLQKKTLLERLLYRIRRRVTSLGQELHYILAARFL